VEYGAVAWTSPCLLSASLSAWAISGGSRTCATEVAEVSISDSDDDDAVLLTRSHRST